MDPNEISFLHRLCDTLCKEPVRVAKCDPSTLVEVNFARMIVKQGPQDGIFEAETILGCVHHTLGETSGLTGEAIIFEREKI
jgi:hypothetical protein